MYDFMQSLQMAEMHRAMFPPGTRILLRSMGTDPRPIEPNTRGTVDMVDDLGTLHCVFDNGRRLGIIPGEDSFRKLTAQELAEEQAAAKDQELDDLLSADTVWICVYKDTLGYPDDFDNLTEINVPTEWLLNELKADGIDPKEWFCEYTADSTETIALKAMHEGVLLDCSDKSIKDSLLKKASSLDAKIQEAQTRAAEGKTSGNTPGKEPER